MIAVVLYQIGDILIAPLLEELGIAVLAFRINPHIETLCHHHYTEGIADFHLHGRRHVVGSTDGVATHLLHHLDLTDESCLVFCCTQRTEFVVQTDFHLHGRRHVVGSTDGVATHLLHHLDLTDESCLVFCCTQRTEFVVQTDTLQFAGNAIELETIILGYGNGSDTGLQGLHISHLLSFISGKFYLIEVRRFRRPEMRIR